MPAVVSDASVLICLGAVQQLHLLKEFYEEVFVPNAVWREVIAATGPRVGATETLHAYQQGWQRHNFRLARDLYEEVLSKVGEIPLPP